MKNDTTKLGHNVRAVHVSSIIALTLLSACAGQPDDTNSSPDGPIDIAITSPVNGAMFTANTLADSGYLVAKVPVTVEISGKPMRIALTRAGKIVGSVDANGQGSVDLSEPGDAALVAVAYDSLDKPVSSDEVTVAVTLPQVDKCRDWLDLYKLDYRVGPATRGIADPVTVQMPILGMGYRYIENTKARTEMLADCTLIHSLIKAAPILKEHNVKEVADIGVYNYRCKGGGVPPGCNLSEHAYAKAIDIGGVTDNDGVFYNVTTDWVIDPAAQKTCEAPTVPGKDEFLHRLICDLKAANVWNIVLTPNYNSDHRNHFHVDLTPGKDTIRSQHGGSSVPLGDD
jgi:Extensin-like protein C-terminus